MNARDHADSTREIAPAEAAKDAILLDNSNLTLEGSVDAVIDIVKKLTSEA